MLVVHVQAMWCIIFQCCLVSLITCVCLAGPTSSRSIYRLVRLTCAWNVLSKFECLLMFPRRVVSYIMLYFIYVGMYIVFLFFIFTIDSCCLKKMLTNQFLFLANTHIKDIAWQTGLPLFVFNSIVIIAECSSIVTYTHLHTYIHTFTLLIRMGESRHATWQNCYCYTRTCIWPCQSLKADAIGVGDCYKDILKVWADKQIQTRIVHINFN